MSKNRSFLGLAVAALLVGAASLAQAQGSNQNTDTWYWNQGGSGAWSTAGNWTLTPSGIYNAPSSISGYDYNEWYGGSVVNNGGTVTVGVGDNVADGTLNGVVFVGGSSDALGGIGGNGNGYINMSGGKISPPLNGRTAGSLWRRRRKRSFHPEQRRQRPVFRGRG